MKLIAVILFIIPIISFSQENGQLSIIIEGDTLSDFRGVSIDFVSEDGSSVPFSDGRELIYSTEVDFSAVTAIRVQLKEKELFFFENISFTDTTSILIDSEGGMPSLSIKPFQSAYRRRADMYLTFSRNKEEIVVDDSAPIEIQEIKKMYHESNFGNTKVSLKYHIANTQFIDFNIDKDFFLVDSVRCVESSENTIFIEEKDFNDTIRVINTGCLYLRLDAGGTENWFSINSLEYDRFISYRDIVGRVKSVINMSNEYGRFVIGKSGDSRVPCNVVLIIE